MIEGAECELLKRAREERGLKLADIAAASRIDVRTLAHLESGRFAALPPGIYARAIVKTYASSVGLDPEATVELFGPLLPPAETSLTALVQTRDHRSHPVEAVAAAEPAAWRRHAASIVDALLLVGIDMVFLSLSASACGVPLLVMLSEAPEAMAVLFVAVAGCYFGLLGGIAGRTCGSHLLGVTVLEPPPGPVDLLLAGRRAIRCLLSEASIVVNLLTPESHRIS